MQLRYQLQIENPTTHYVKVRIDGQRPEGVDELTFFLPAWSPGSYLMREYGRHILKYQATTETGAPLGVERTGKSSFTLNWKLIAPETKSSSFSFTYDVYCHELTVRTSHVDETHAFIHGPSVFMGILGHEVLNPTLDILMPPAWSKISTGLKDISPSREIFRYTAANYDDFIDTPIELGCHETDGFMVKGVEHELAFYGNSYTHHQNIKEDMKTIVETVLKTTRDIPYEKYTFVTHFAPQLFGGLEHSNSTALHFCPLKMSSRMGYLHWLSLVAHEYFHTWNVKRIRPKELGPFDYLNEAMTKMHWLTEGLTSFVDELFVLRSGLCRMEEYLEMQKININRFLATPGRRFHSLEESSYLAWVKLYRPDENSSNSSVSYYLKGGLVFSILHKDLVDHGKSIDDLIHLLWKRYLENPSVGLECEEVYQMIESLSSKAVREKFETMVTTTEEIPLEATWEAMGVHFEFDENPDRAYLGVRWKYEGERVFIETCELDGPSYRPGLNAGDELISINDIRVTKTTLPDFEQGLKLKEAYRFLVARLGKLIQVEIIPSKLPRTNLKSLKIDDRKQLERYLNV